MKNKTKKLFFTYIAISVLTIITPITIVCGTSYHTNKTANSKQTNRTINKVQKVPNFVNANLFQNTNYGTSTITIDQTTGLVNGGNTFSGADSAAPCIYNGGDYINSAINSFLSNLNNNANSAMSSFENNNAIPQNIDWKSSALTNKTNISGGLNIWIASYDNYNWYGMISNIFNLQNNSLEYSLNNCPSSYSNNNNTVVWDSNVSDANEENNLQGQIPIQSQYNNIYYGGEQWNGYKSNCPLQVQGNMSFTGFNNG
ncbi:MAG: hypothetical protein IIT81_00455, partial [Mycoplasmataceae bacterium]|nr:hypothetical protein [Mycoplasmataceae bacterium]